MVSTERSTPVRPGTLYRTRGTSHASATAVKCAARPACDGCLEKGKDKKIKSRWWVVGWGSRFPGGGERVVLFEWF